MYFAIRDDDTSYYTKPEELISAYKELSNLPISLSVVPKATYRHGSNLPYGDGVYDMDEVLVGENEELVSFLKGKISEHSVEIVMHGITHRYYRENSCWIPEMNNFKFQDSFQELQKMREYLESVFSTKISVFAAPSNSLNCDAHKALDILGLDTMGFLTKRIDHPISPAFLRYYLKRNICKLFNIEQPFAMKFKNHKELPVFQLQEPEIMWRNYLSCKNNGGIPFIIYTHYWHLNKCECDKRYLIQMVEKMTSDGAKPVLVSDCFKVF